MTKPPSPLTLGLWIVFAACALVGAFTDGATAILAWVLALAVGVALLVLSRRTGRPTPTD